MATRSAIRRDVVSMRVQPVEEINAQAGRGSFRLDEVPWHLGVDRTKLFSPESMLHLTYCPSYRQLTDEEKLYYNQVHSMGICEEFSFLEEMQFVRGLGAWLQSAGDTLESPLRGAIANFIEEEKKHSAMFKRLVALADPEAYRDGRFRICVLGKVETGLLNFCLDRPETFIGWVWSAMLFEEKTLDFYKKYNTCTDLERVDPLFHAVHRFHAIDEVRHVQLDHYFIERAWAAAPPWKRWINTQLVHRVLWSFTHPKRTARRTIAILVAKFPRLRPLEGTLVREMMDCWKNPVWQDTFYSRRSMPRTFSELDRFPELHDLHTVFPCYSPAPPSPSS